MDFNLRPWRDGDENSIVTYADNPRIACFLRNAFPYPHTLRDAREYVSSCVNGDPGRMLVRAIEVGGEAVGSIGLFLGSDVYCKNAELGYWLGEPYWRQGIMSAAVRELCAEAFQTYAVTRIYAEPFADNIASRKTLEKAGFVLEGIMKKSVWKNNEYHDSCIYALIR